MSGDPTVTSMIESLGACIAARDDEIVRLRAELLDAQARCLRIESFARSLCDTNNKKLDFQRVSANA